MYLAVPARQSPAEAWLEATCAVNAEQRHEAHNVIIDVADPSGLSAADNQIERLVDGFLRTHGTMPLQAVANTIFPDALYRRYGAPDFMKRFHERVLPRIRRTDRWSGYYFERMIALPAREGEPINQLWGIVERIRDTDNKSRNKFEVSLFDAERDVDNSPYGGQCLSFLSFKLTGGHEKALALTALYRNHYYVEKLLGNLIGLGRLMAFVAKESGVAIGPLTIVSTHAVVDTPKASRRSDVTELISACQAAHTESEAA